MLVLGVGSAKLVKPLGVANSLRVSLRKQTSVSSIEVSTSPTPAVQYKWWGSETCQDMVCLNFHGIDEAIKVSTASRIVLKR